MPATPLDQRARNAETAAPSREPGARVLVAMSGGVDSAVAAALLHDRGYEVIGVTLRLYTEPDGGALRSRRSCCGVEDVADARAAAQRIGIPHYVLNMEREFGRDVIDRFATAYAEGRTPNPCLDCNDRVKFSSLLARTEAFGMDLLATGHYARIERHPGHAGDRYSLHAAVDASKDQSYVLYTLGQAQLARTLFPLGDLPKSETRRIAADLGLAVADKPDSADICFVPGGDYRALLHARGVEARPGPILDGSGAEIGRHQGVAGFTVGQRRGLGIAAGERRYVTAVDAVANAVVVGSERELLAEGVAASDPRWVDDPPALGARVQARIRYHATPLIATVTHIDERGFELQFATPARALAPGQAVVLYGEDNSGTRVIGGGTIEGASARATSSA